jgi:hypothetical protein
VLPSLWGVLARLRGNLNFNSWSAILLYRHNKRLESQNDEVRGHCSRASSPSLSLRNVYFPRSRRGESSQLTSLPRFEHASAEKSHFQQVVPSATLASLLKASYDDSSSATCNLLIEENDSSIMSLCRIPYSKGAWRFIWFSTASGCQIFRSRV